MSKILFTSESVTEGHPDKICDQISDAVLDNIISKDPFARVACETAVTTGMVLIMGEISTNCYVDIPKVARQTLADIGYNSPEYGFDSNSCAIITSIDEQSSDIAVGVNHALEQREGLVNDSDLIGAGDQGIMFGYACDETPELMPLPISLAHALSKKLSEVRKKGLVDFLRPDGKTQVTFEYQNGIPIRIDSIVVSCQHREDTPLSVIKDKIMELVIKPIVPDKLTDNNTKFFINPTGRFVIGGPRGDSGLTGRKIIVDTYGGYSRHGGGAFSGKDPTKVDRSAAYMARYVAKNIVKSGIASKCEVGLAYAIGVSSPVSVMVETFNTSKFENDKISKFVQQNFDLSPNGIISSLNLRTPIYKNLATYGHMGREDLGVLWENTDKSELIKDYFK